MRADRHARPVRRPRRPSTRRRATTAAGPTSRRPSTSPCAREGSPSGRWSSATRSRFASSARPASAASATSRPSPRPRRSRNRLARYPELEFKLDPENDWDARADRGDRRARAGAGARPEGHVRGHPGRRRHRPGALPRGRRGASPTPTSRTPTSTTRPARCSRRIDDRITWDAPLHSLADVKEHGPQGDQLEALAVRLAARSCSTIYEYCDANGIAVYGGGQGEVECGRGQIQYLASLFHAATPNDVAPSGYNDPAVPAGMPTSPMDPAPSETGFRWAEE